MVAGSPSNIDDQARAPGDLAVQDAQPSIGQKIRVLIAKPGLDGHDRGAKIIARALRDAGLEVIYTGLHQTPEMVAEAALQEDVDAVGLSILSGAHMALFPRIMEELRKRGLDDVMVYAGGIIPDEDIPAIKEMGVAGVFGPGTPMAETVRFVRQNVKPRQAEEE
ncbi:MAG TPA: cobalamin B12-binding domain-containing protein [Chloroflexia bacterium]|nr:cobalamin B12-binding domain-containing protein [Chloroflexia bacterium]